MQGGAPRRLALFQEGGSPTAPWGRSRMPPPCRRERVRVGRGALLAGGNEPQPRGPVCPRSGLASCCSLLSLPRACVCVKLPVGNRVPLSLATLPRSALRRVRHLRVREQQEVGWARTPTGRSATASRRARGSRAGSVTRRGPLLRTSRGLGYWLYWCTGHQQVKAAPGETLRVPPPLLPGLLLKIKKRSRASPAGSGEPPLRPPDLGPGERGGPCARRAFEKPENSSAQVGLKDAPQFPLRRARLPSVPAPRLWAHLSGEGSFEPLRYNS